MSCQKPTDEEINLWNGALVRQGLSMEKGHDPRRITYGWKYREADAPFDYTDDFRPLDNNEVENLESAAKLLSLISAGVPLVTAAKELGIRPFNARRTLARFEKRKKLHPAPPCTQVEGKSDASE